MKLRTRCGSRPSLRLLTGVVLSIVTVTFTSLGVVGCHGSSSSSDGSSSNSTGPLITAVEYVDLDGNGVDVGDVLVFTFDTIVRVSSSNVGSYSLGTTGDSLGSAPSQSQSVPGSTRIEVILGSSPTMVPGTSRINIRSVGLVYVEDHSGDDARPASTNVLIADATSTAPELVGSTYSDHDQDGTVNVGDTLLVSFTKPVTVAGGQTVAGNFALPVTSDSFGTSPTLNVFSAGTANRGVLITLGATPTLTVSGGYSASATTAGSPSGVAMAASPGLTDTTTGLVAVTGSTEGDLGAQGSTLYHLNLSASLFPGTIDSGTADVTANGFNGPQGVFHFNGDVTISGTTFTGVDLFFVADTDNNRVLVYTGRPTGNNASAFAVLGQDDMNSNLPNESSATTPSPSASTLWGPTDVHFYSTTNQLFVSDTSNNRILIFNNVLSSTTGLYDLADGADADILVGQSGFTSRSANQGASLPDSRTLADPYGISVSDGQLAIADCANHRVMIWSSIPTSNNAAASTVLGQSSFGVGLVNGGGSASAATMSAPQDVFLDLSLDINANATNGAFIVADTGNNRVLAFISPTPATGSSADGVLGQVDFTSTSANQGGAVAAGSLDSPTGLAADDNQLWVADRDNHRVVYFDTTTLTDGEAGSGFLGQSNGTSSTENQGGTPSASTLSFPQTVHINEADSAPDDRLFICDTQNHRVLDFSTLPTSTTAASLEQGQPSFASSDAKGHRLNSPADVTFTGGKMIAADNLNNRVVIYNTVPTTGDPAPDLALGQENLFDGLENQGGSTTPAADTMSAPESVATDGTRLIVADTGNNRVLVFSTIPATSGVNADIVLGQSAMTGSTANSGGLSGATLDSPSAVLIAGGKLYVCDRDNHRVLIWNDVTALTDGKVADLVLGQDDLTSNLANKGASTTSSSLDTPNDVLVVGSLLYIADSGNNRILGFGSIPTVSAVAGTFVVGQFQLTDHIASVTRTRLKAPTGLATDGSRLVIGDTGNNRVMLFEFIPSGFGQSASVTFGQASYTIGLDNKGGATPDSRSLSSPRGVFFNGQDLWISDSGNSRLVRHR